MGTTTTNQSFYKPGSGETGYGSLVNANMDVLDNAFIDAGAWSSATAYKVGAAVLLSGVYYKCILAHTNHTPPNGTYWTPFATITGLGGLAAANNLSDVASAATAISNLGAVSTSDGRLANPRTGLVAYGTHSARPGTGTDQALYFETDTTSLFQYETGTGWVQVGPSVAQTATNTTNIATNTSNIATNTTAIGTPTSNATANQIAKRDGNAAANFGGVQIGGSDAVPTIPSHFVQASGNNGASNDTAGESICLHTKTTTNTAIELLDKNSARFTLATNTTAAFFITITGRATAANSCAWKAEGMISRDTGNITLVGGTLSLVNGCALPTGWTAPTVTFSTSDQSIRITSGYATTTNIVWKATLDIERVTL